MATDITLNNNNASDLNTSIQHNQEKFNQSHLSITLSLKSLQDEAIICLQNHEFKEAFNIITHIIEVSEQAKDEKLADSTTAILYLVRGIISFYNKDYGQTVLDLTNTVNRVFADRVVNYYLAAAFFYGKRYKESIGYFNEALCPAEPLSVQGVPEVWLNCLNTVFTLEIHDADIWLFIARAWVALQHRENALNAYQLALVNELKRENSQSRQAVIYFSMAKLKDKVSDVCEDYQEAIRLDPQNPKFYTMGYADFFKQMGEYEIACSIYTNILKFNKLDDTTSAEIFFKLAVSYQQQDKHELAVQYFTQSLQLNPQNALSYELRAKSNFELEDYQNARKDIITAIKIDPKLEAGNEDFYIKFGDALYKRFYHQDAIKLFEKALQSSNDKADLYCRIGCAQHAQGCYEDAIMTFDKVIALKSDHAKAYYRRGLAKQALLKQLKILNNNEPLAVNTNELVMEDYNFAIQHNSNLVEDYSIDVDNSRKTKDECKIAEAEKNLEKSKNRLAKIYIQRSNYTNSWSDLNEALKVAPCSSDALFQMGYVDDAFKLAAKKQKRSTRTALLLAKIYQHKQDLVTAASFYEQVIHASSHRPDLRHDGLQGLTNLRSVALFKTSLQERRKLAKEEAEKKANDMEAQWMQNSKSTRHITFWEKGRGIIKESQIREPTENQQIKNAGSQPHAALIVKSNSLKVESSTSLEEELKQAIPRAHSWNVNQESNDQKQNKEIKKSKKHKKEKINNIKTQDQVSEDKKPTKKIRLCLIV